MVAQLFGWMDGDIRAWVIIFRVMQRNLMDNILRICSHLEHTNSAGSFEMPGKRSHLVTREQFNSVGLDEMDRMFNAVSAKACQLDPCLS